MPQQICNRAKHQCRMGMVPSSMVVLQVNRMSNGNQPDAKNHIP